MEHQPLQNNYRHAAAFFCIDFFKVGFRAGGRTEAIAVGLIAQGNFSGKG
jgi:hypothetical protein